MVKLFAFVCAFIVCIAVVKPQNNPIVNQQQQQQPYVVNYTNFQTPGGYFYNVQLSDYSSKQETGMLEDVQDENNKTVKAIKATGSYQFIAPDGTINMVTYVADKTGYHPRVSRANINSPQSPAPNQTPNRAPNQAPNPVVSVGSVTSPQNQPNRPLASVQPNNVVQAVRPAVRIF